MLKIILKALIIIEMINVGNVYCQKQSIWALKIGDAIPQDIRLNLVNTTKKSVKFSEFKGKLVILDFWNVWCGSCIEAMPHMEALQNKFGEKIAIILVTPDPQSKIDILRLTSKNLQNTKLPMVVADTVLTKLIRYPSVPTHAYIDPEGKIVSITSGTYTNEESIEKILNGEKPYLPEQKALENFNPLESFLTEGEGRHISNFSSYVIFTNYVEGGGQGGTSQRDSSTGNLLWWHQVAMSVLTGYGHIFSRGQPELFNNYRTEKRYMIDSLRRNEFIGSFDDIDKWQRTYLFGYERRLKKGSTQDFYDVMKDDFDRQFEVRSSVEKRKVKCLVLVKSEGKVNLNTSGGNPISVEHEGGYSYIQINKPLKYLSTILNLRIDEIPVIDETHYKGNVDIKLKSELKDIVSIRKELKANGLELVEAERELDMIVLRDNRKPSK